MKDLGKIKIFLDLQIEHLLNEIFIHQSTYTEKILKRFYIGQITPIEHSNGGSITRCEKNIFRPWEDNEELVGPEVPYLSAIGAIMYLANNMRPNITFSLNFLARYSFFSNK